MSKGDETRNRAYSVSSHILKAARRGNKNGTNERGAGERGEETRITFLVSEDRVDRYHLRLTSTGILLI